jgi:hypothetical protein
MLQSRSLMAALSAAGALPQSVTRSISTPSDYQRHQGHWRVVQTLLAIDPGPAVAALKLPKSWTWPRRLPWNGASPTTQSVVVINGLAFYHPGDYMEDFPL